MCSPGWGACVLLPDPPAAAPSPPAALSRLSSPGHHARAPLLRAAAHCAATHPPAPPYFTSPAARYAPHILTDATSQVEHSVKGLTASEAGFMQVRVRSAATRLRLAVTASVSHFFPHGEGVAVGGKGCVQVRVGGLCWGSLLGVEQWVGGLTIGQWLRASSLVPPFFMGACRLCLAGGWRAVGLQPHQPPDHHPAVRLWQGQYGSPWLGLGLGLGLGARGLGG